MLFGTHQIFFQVCNVRAVYQTTLCNYLEIINTNNLHITLFQIFNYYFLFLYILLLYSCHVYLCITFVLPFTFVCGRLKLISIMFTYIRGASGPCFVFNALRRIYGAVREYFWTRLIYRFRNDFQRIMDERATSPRQGSPIRSITSICPAFSASVTAPPPPPPLAHPLSESRDFTRTPLTLECVSSRDEDLSPPTSPHCSTLVVRLLSHRLR